MNPNKFYNQLKTVTSFREGANPDCYTPLPDDWYLAIADIRNSTKAIQNGKYKEVNMAGASIITALNNFVGQEYHLPYFFGGDGSCIALPGDYASRIEGILAFCKQTVKNAYGLEMAIGLVSMEEIRRNGHDIGVARLQLSEDLDQPIFWGSGLAYAESLIKKSDRLAHAVPTEADFSGLECRWSHLPSQKDEVAAYIIQTLSSDDEEKATVYDRCFQKIESIYGDDNDFHPIQEQALRLERKPQILGTEFKLRTQHSTLPKKVQHLLLMIFQLISGFYLMKFKKKTSKTDWGAYKPDLARHADYKKVGDGLRFVASGTVEQRLEFTDFLEQMYQEKKLVYGAHPSPAAMVTCYVKSYQKKHVHFVDGTDGGYAKAAQKLKKRKNQLSCD